MSSPKDSPEQAEFRRYCRDWLHRNSPHDPDFRLPQSSLEIMTTEQLGYLKAWQLSAYEAGLVGCDYPKEVGGGGRVGFQRIANLEMQAAKTPFFPNGIGLGMAAPTVFFHAQDKVKQELIPKILSGEEIWCQGFSEPGAGSDLANVQTFAEPKGDKWVINGHKVWTSLAHFADWMILLVRTSKEHKHAGLSYFVVPIRSALTKGVTVRPLIKMTGETGFNEVFFENLEVDDKYRLDEVGRGWHVAMTTLAHERSAGKMETPQAGGRVQKQKDEDSKDKLNGSGARSLIELARASFRNGASAAADPIIRDRIIQEIIRETAFTQDKRRAQVAGLVDDPSRIPLQNKLVWSEMMQDIAQLAVEIEGPAGTLYMADPNAPAAGRWPLAYMNSFGATIAAGTNEVQRNILGERVLGLPKTK